MKATRTYCTWSVLALTSAWVTRKKPTRRHRDGYLYPPLPGLCSERFNRKKGESLLSSTPVVVLSTIQGRTPTMEEYEKAVDGIVLTKFSPPNKELSTLAAV